MKKYKISVLLVIILCFTLLPSYATASGTENVVESKEIAKKEGLEKQKAIWAELFHILVKIESNELYDINNNVTSSKERIEDTFSFVPEYGLGYTSPNCFDYAGYGSISLMYSTMLGHCSWSGHQSGCQPTGNCSEGGSGQDCGQPEGGPCEF